MVPTISRFSVQKNLKIVKNIEKLLILLFLRVFKVIENDSEIQKVKTQNSGSNMAEVSKLKN